jgi:hypothetical protein
MSKNKFETMNFDKLWEHQQGAVFLKQDEIYAHRKNLAEFFFRMGYEYGKNEERERTFNDHMFGLINQIKLRDIEIEQLKQDNAILIETVNYYADWNNHGPKGYAEAREALKKIGVT